MVHKLADCSDPKKKPELKDVRYVGDPTRPVYLVRTEERKAYGRARSR
jgi:hypothetical protein